MLFSIKTDFSIPNKRPQRHNPFDKLQNSCQNLIKINFRAQIRTINEHQPKPNPKVKIYNLIQST